MILLIGHLSGVTVVEHVWRKDPIMSQEVEEEWLGQNQAFITNCLLRTTLSGMPQGPPNRLTSLTLQLDEVSALLVALIYDFEICISSEAKIFSDHSILLSFGARTFRNKHASMYSTQKKNSRALMVAKRQGIGGLKVCIKTQANLQNIFAR